MASFPTSNPFYGMNDLSAALAIRLLLEDSELLSAASKGKCKGGEFSDAELALASYKSDLEQTSQAISDRCMTRSIGAAVQTDGNLLTEFWSQEQEASTDRSVALRFGGLGVTPAIPPWIVSSAEMDEELLEKLSARYIGSPSENSTCAGPVKTYDHEDESDESPPFTGFGGRSRHSKKRRCTACQDFVDYSRIARAPCTHEYCEECLRNLFESSMTDESLFPPRCCKQPIPVEAVRIFLTSELARQYEQKKIEFETVNRTYCSSPRCSAFLRTNDIKGDRGTCPDCGQVTCIMCKAVAHEGDCPADTDLQLVLATAAENGWQRCYSCRRLVELDLGCNHITYVSPLVPTHAFIGTPTNFRTSCTCGSQFCYICAGPWRTCVCPQWNEDRLLSRAEQIVARRPRVPGPPPAEQIAAEMQNLRDRHNCNHGSWRYVSGSHQCEECRYTLPSYIFEYNQCRIRACNRCRRNRL
jgi:hypothetical protein